MHFGVNRANCDKSTNVGMVHLHMYYINLYGKHGCHVERKWPPSWIFKRPIGQILLVTPKEHPCQI